MSYLADGVVERRHERGETLGVVGHLGAMRGDEEVLAGLHAELA